MCFFCPMPLESFFLITWLKSRDDKKLKMQCNGLNHKNLEPHFYIHFVGEKSQQHWQRPRHVWRIVVESSGGMWAGTPNSSLGISSHLASTWALVSKSSFSPLPSNPLKSIMLTSSKFFGIAQVQYLHTFWSKILQLQIVIIAGLVIDRSKQHLGWMCHCQVDHKNMPNAEPQEHQEWMP